jgi:hypothetical protein
MIKCTVLSTVKGTIVFKDIINRGLIAGEEFLISEDMFNSDAIQGALKKNYIKCNYKSKDKSTVYITNTTRGSISIDGFGILQSGKSAKVSKDILENLHVKSLVKNKKLILGDKSFEVDKKVDDTMSVIMDLNSADAVEVEPVTKKISKSKASKKVAKTEKIKEDKKEDSDEIKWVDVEQQEEKLSKHPVLGKKKHSISSRHKQDD